MYLLAVGLVMLLLKSMEIGPVAKLEWWQVLIPFGLAVLWWSFADRSGYTSRKAMEALEKRKRERIQKNREALRGPRQR